MNVLLDRDQSKFPLLKARWSRTDCGQDLPRGFIKLSHVPHDVHMTHVVAVPRVNHATVRNQGFGHEGILPHAGSQPPISRNAYLQRRRTSLVTMGSSRPWRSNSVDD